MSIALVLLMLQEKKNVYKKIRSRNKGTPSSIQKSLFLEWDITQGYMTKLCPYARLGIRLLINPNKERFTLANPAAQHPGRAPAAIPIARQRARKA